MTEMSNKESTDCARERRDGIEIESVLTCPHCGKQSREKMPTDACLFFFTCRGCGTRLKPKPGHCCVFCSYGSVKCPPIQAGSGCSPCNCDS